LKIFLDHCVPKRLQRLLAEHEVKTAYQMGWAAEKNGELLKLVESEFEVSSQLTRICGTSRTSHPARSNSSS
jgi:hypothetical protein